MHNEVVIVDDDKIVVFLHTTLLKKLDFAQNPRIFENGDDAVKFFRSSKANADNYLILLDIAMPVMDGWEFLDALKDNPVYQKCKIVMITSSIDMADKNKVDQFANIIDYVEKPLTADKIHQLKQIPEIKQLIS